MRDVPVLDARLAGGTRADRLTFCGRLLDAAHETGSFYVTTHTMPPTICSEVLEGARQLFAELSAEEKQFLHINGSSNFRGYSDMKNDRDWREQMHFGPERCPPPAIERGYRRLVGPNQWPQRFGAGWRDLMLAYLASVGDLGRRVLSVLAVGLGLPADAFAGPRDDDAYLLMKLLCYHPQTDAEEPARVGVAAHCDWSWLTFLLQDGTGGLQVRTPAGGWTEMPPVPETFAVNVGELVEIVTGGELVATPHRVTNRSVEMPRISIPVFVNPALSVRIHPRADRVCAPDPSPEHVHRVIDPGQPVAPFVFGESEWRRKGLGYWCHRAACLPAATLERCRH